jgi:uncharacterized protein YjbI with pentapeptide repeats
MANPDNLKMLQHGADAWNAWRRREPVITPSLSEANLSRANLNDANLTGADLTYASG